MSFLQNFNLITLRILAPILILTGISGYFIPPEYSLMSTAPFYNLFHINAGIIGMICLLTGSIMAVRIFNYLFGLIEIYQVIASWMKIFPAELFQYTFTDDLLHMNIGAFLIFIAVAEENRGRNPSAVAEK